MSSRRKPKKQKNTEYMIITYLFVALFLALMGYIVYFQIVKSEDVINSSYNNRQELLAEKVVRGSIYSADEKVLAETVVDSDGNEVRNYPYKNVFAHAIGYNTLGKSGIESQYSFSMLQCDNLLPKRLFRELIGEKNQGNALITTYNADLQETAYNALGNYKGAVVALEPDTGKILVMVSKPDYDPNQIAVLWDDLTSGDSDDSRLLNRATQGLYPPGSTFKIVTATAYLDQHNNKYTSYEYDCNSKISNDDITINCYRNKAHGNIDLLTSFAKSCNTSFSNMGLSLDRGEFAATCTRLLFNQSLPLSKLSSKSSTVVLETDTSDSDVMQTAIGQGKTLMTPMHLAMITSAIANDGTLMIPYQVDKIKTSDGGTVKTYKSKSYGRLFSKEQATILQEFMAAVVSEGTGTKLQSSKYDAYGKTGSAEYNNEKGKSHSWFTGYAKKDEKKLVVTVIVEEAGSGSEYAVPVAKKIWDAYFD